ncbi:CAP domain-containing protein [Ferdinandcohnia sp. Marseille-Q9671]
MILLKVAKIVAIVLLLVSSIYFISINHGRVEKIHELDAIQVVTTHTNSLKENEQYKYGIQQFDGLYSFIGMEQSKIKDILGEPKRIDYSSYDYVWWVYNSDPKNYIQVGIENNKVVTVFGTGDNVNISPFHIGQPIEELQSKGLIKPEISLSVEKNPYRFELTEQELNTNPLIAMGSVYVQLYVDTFTKSISSVRFLDGKTLIKLRPYELAYRGELLSANEVSSNEWKLIEQGNTAQILDLSNIIRMRHGIPPLKWDEQTAEVAYLHSKDMSTNQYFDHVSPTKGGLAERLAQGNVSYLLAGENIAAKYIDGIAAVEGWLNSEGHRDTLLHEEYNYLGVGVYEKYYTQNFIQKN